MKRFLALLLCLCTLLCLVACDSGTENPGTSTPQLENPSDPPASDPPATDPPVTDPPATDPPATEPPATEPPATEPPATEPPATEPPVTQPPVTEKPYVNLVAGFANGVDTTDKHKTWGWDAENKYITASHSLECTWGTDGYGKVFLVDGVKAEEVDLVFTQGAWISCEILPGWGDFSGELDDSTITWKKADLDEWLIFDLQGTCIVDKVTFSTLYKNGQYGMPADFVIQVSSDKTNWKTVHTEKGYEQDILSLDQVFTFAAEECRYVKLHFTKTKEKIDNNLAYCVGLSEVEIWGKQK